MFFFSSYYRLETIKENENKPNILPSVSIVSDFKKLVFVKLLGSKSEILTTNPLASPNSHHEQLTQHRSKSLGDLCPVFTSQHRKMTEATLVKLFDESKNVEFFKKSSDYSSSLYFFI